MWDRLVNGHTNTATTPDAQRGKEWETWVVELYRRALNVPARRWDQNAIVVGPEEWATCTPDAVVPRGNAHLFPSGVPTLHCNDGYPVECKTDSSDHRYHWGKSGAILEAWDPESSGLVVRPDYAMQCYYQMWCMNTQVADICVLLPYFDFRWYRLYRDDKVIDALVELVSKWYRDYVLTGNPPPIDGSSECRSWLNRQFELGTIDKKNKRLASDYEAALMDHLWTTKQGIEEAKNTLSHLRVRESEFANKLIESVGATYGVQHPDNPNFKLVCPQSNRGGKVSRSVRLYGEPQAAITKEDHEQ